MGKNPWLKFYPADWRADPALKVSSLAARGLWVEMLAIMHESEPRGLLAVKGRAVTSTMLAQLVGADETVVSKLVDELEANGVFSRKKNGVIYSRRMESDENRARKNKENGKLGGNPSLCNQTENGQSVNPEDKAKKPEARSQKEKRETNVSPKKSGSRLPIDWFPSQPDIDFAKQEGLSEHSINTEAAKFRDYWHAKTGQGASKLDWSATWRNWIRNAPKRHPSTSQAKQPSNLDRFKEAIRLAEEQERGHTNSSTDRPPVGQLRVVSG